MKRIGFVALGCLLALVPLVAHAQSSSLPVCSGQDGYFLTASPWYAQDQTLFLSQSDPGAIWQSTDAGRTWAGVVDMSRYRGVQFGPVSIVPVESTSGFRLYSPWTVFSNATLVARLLWYSDDSGTTWLSRTPTPGQTDSRLYPTDNPAIMFALVDSSPQWPSTGIWRTYPLNTSWWWQWVLESTNALDLAVSPDYLEDQTVFAALESVSPELGSPVIVSTDGGETWQGRGDDDLCSEGAGSIQISSGFPEDHTLFVHQASSLFRSQDAGETWEVVFPRDRPHCQPGVLAPTADSYKLSSNFGQDHTLYMVTTGPNDDQRLLVSGDGGATWDYQSSVSRSTSLLWVLAAAENRGGSETDEAGNALFAGAMAEGTSASSGVRAAAPKSNWTAFLPLIDWSAAQPTARSFTLFINAWNEMDESTYYRSDDGGVTWACMLLPTVQPPGRTNYFGRER
ncbi:MAG: exo-alpha-sialidase [Anaerolineae bacterium]|nr:exo-alpha-sialidase [Anaerolineae bacterium]MCB0238945.1 exo-alpha-sialidase [Anaerolineae bacterium]MCB0250262.1 exo-alpha-sialidase [Anaerolineae bacterium]MCB9133412.1 exo-alpha-sialidase [Anaerolineales bacterium]MCO5245709.1 glycoside hydrolase [Anaerolineae bacterium]